eukprot:11474479-Alexandrium_andersonii.AAC.1
MQEARRRGAGILALAETQLAQQSIPSASRTAYLAGWHFIATPRSDARRGGLAILVAADALWL